MVAPELVIVVSLLNIEVKITFTPKIILLVAYVATKSKYLVPTSFSFVESTCK